MSLQILSKNLSNSSNSFFSFFSNDSEIKESRRRRNAKIRVSAESSTVKTIVKSFIILSILLLFRNLIPLPCIKTSMGVMNDFFTIKLFRFVRRCRHFLLFPISFGNIKKEDAFYVPDLEALPVNELGFSEPLNRLGFLFYFSAILLNTFKCEFLSILSAPIILYSSISTFTDNFSVEKSNIYFTRMISIYDFIGKRLWGKKETDKHYLKNQSTQLRNSFLMSLFLEVSFYFFLFSNNLIAFTTFSGTPIEELSHSNILFILCFFLFFLYIVCFKLFDLYKVSFLTKMGIFTEYEMLNKFIIHIQGVFFLSYFRILDINEVVSMNKDLSSVLGVFFSAKNEFGEEISFNNLALMKVLFVMSGKADLNSSTAKLNNKILFFELSLAYEMMKKISDEKLQLLSTINIQNTEVIEYVNSKRFIIQFLEDKINNRTIYSPLSTFSNVSDSFNEYVRIISKNKYIKRLLNSNDLMSLSKEKCMVLYSLHNFLIRKLDFIMGNTNKEEKIIMIEEFFSSTKMDDMIYGTDVLKGAIPDLFHASKEAKDFISLLFLCPSFITVDNVIGFDINSKEIQNKILNTVFESFIFSSSNVGLFAKNPLFYSSYATNAEYDLDTKISYFWEAIKKQYIVQNMDLFLSLNLNAKTNMQIDVLNTYLEKNFPKFDLTKKPYFYCENVFNHFQRVEQLDVIYWLKQFDIISFNKIFKTHERKIKNILSSENQEAIEELNSKCISLSGAALERYNSFTGMLLLLFYKGYLHLPLESENFLLEQKAHGNLIPLRPLYSDTDITLDTLISDGKYDLFNLHKEANYLSNIKSMNLDLLNEFEKFTFFHELFQCARVILSEFALLEYRGDLVQLMEKIKEVESISIYSLSKKSFILNSIPSFKLAYALNNNQEELEIKLSSFIDNFKDVKSIFLFSFTIIFFIYAISWLLSFFRILDRNLAVKSLDLFMEKTTAENTFVPHPNMLLIIITNVFYMYNSISSRSEIVNKEVLSIAKLFKCDQLGYLIFIYGSSRVGYENFFMSYDEMFYIQIMSPENFTQLDVNKIGHRMGELILAVSAFYIDTGDGVKLMFIKLVFSLILTKLPKGKFGLDFTFFDRQRNEKEALFNKIFFMEFFVKIVLFKTFYIVNYLIKKKIFSTFFKERSLILNLESAENRVYVNSDKSKLITNEKVKLFDRLIKSTHTDVLSLFVFYIAAYLDIKITHSVMACACYIVSFFVLFKKIFEDNISLLPLESDRYDETTQSDFLKFLHKISSFIRKIKVIFYALISHTRNLNNIVKTRL